MKTPLSAFSTNGSRNQEWKQFLESLDETKAANKPLLKTTERPLQLIYHLSQKFPK